MKPIDQPVEGAHASKQDVPDPATSAVAGEGKGVPADEKLSEAAEVRAQETLRRAAISSG
jgi:hypothetical protein